MAKIVINKDKCKSCMLCVSVCPQRIIIKSNKLNKLGMYYVELSKNEKAKCTGCALCAIMCPDVCIEVHK